MVVIELWALVFKVWFKETDCDLGYFLEQLV